MKTILFALVTILSFSFLTSCGDTEPVLPVLDFRYDQTQCNDPWGYDQDDDKQVALLSAYLAERSIDVSDLLFNGDQDIITCLACDCPTGKVFTLTVEEEDIEALEALGFVSL